MAKYKELEIMSYAESCALERKPLGPGMYLTGHHMIPDHCFYVCKGGRTAQGVKTMQILGTAAYRTDAAPVIMLTSDSTGGKMLNHGYVHDHFDPVEKERSVNNTWTYEEVRAVAVESITSVFDGVSAATIESALDRYFVDTIGLQARSVLRCGEHSSLADSPYAPEKRRSGRTGRKFTPY